MAWEARTFNGILHTEAQDELLARLKQTETAGDSYIALPVDLVYATILEKPPCPSRTIVNGDRARAMLIEIQCTKRVDPATRKHDGMHVNGKNAW